ncbi:MAG: Uma2 family endonuclease [Gemmataceae bacterium]
MSLAPQALVSPTTYGLDASIPRFTVAKYQRMIESGGVDEDDDVELLEGYVVLKMPRSPSHDNAIDRITDILQQHRPPGWRVRVQSAITLSDSQPEPDISVVLGDLSQFEHRHPQPPEIGLVVEVADSSLSRDMSDKARMYAAAAIPIYWVVNLNQRSVEVFTHPSGPVENPSYAKRITCRQNDAVQFVLDGSVITTTDAASLVG